MTDLVEYLIVVAPDRDSMAGIVPALVDLVSREMIRILDLVVLVAHRDGTVEVLELEAVESLVGLQNVDGEIGGLLSAHDIELASIGLKPNSAALVLVTEDRWAEPLSRAARLAGGEIVAGERIARSRVEAVLADHLMKGQNNASLRHES